MFFFTTSSKIYFENNCKYLALSLLNYSNRKLIVYSEDDLSEYSELIQFVPLIRKDELMKFQTSFRSIYSDTFKFMPYSARMDIWVFKITAQLQFLSEHINSSGVYIDSDSVVLNNKFINVIDKFINPCINYDIGLFRRCGKHLHPESGFMFLSSNKVTNEVYLKMLNDIFTFQFYNLPSWTDCSLIDKYIINGQLDAFDFCSNYNLVTDNPVYESALSSSLLHLKGKRRKGKYSIIKHFIGWYK